MHPGVKFGMANEHLSLFANGQKRCFVRRTKVYRQRGVEKTTQLNISFSVYFSLRFMALKCLTDSMF